MHSHPPVTGDIGAGNPRRAKSNGGIVGEVALKCGGVLGPAVPNSGVQQVTGLGTQRLA